jgi:nitrogen regulatory protein P-II 1
MKKVEAIIRPFKLDDVTGALIAIGVKAMTVYDVQGFGKQRAHADHHSGDEFMMDLLSRTKIEFIIEDELVEQVIDTIRSTAKTGKIGDGKIFIYPVEEAVRIRSGERGNAAL